MAVPAYATDLTDITTSFSTGWSLISEGGGGQNAITAPETDDFIQGTESVSRNPFSSSIRGVQFAAGTTIIAADDAVYYWWKADVAAALDTLAGGGVSLNMGSSTTAYDLYSVAGNNTYAIGGWRCSPIDPVAATASRTVGTPGANTQFGVSYDVPATGPTKGFPFKCDMIRHGRSIDVTAGEIANPATWNALAAESDLTANRYGIVAGAPTGAEVQGVVNWGTAAAFVYSRDANRSIVLVDTCGFTATDFTQLIFNNASTDLEWTNISVRSLDTLNRGIITVNNNAPVSFFGCSFSDINTTADGGTNSVWDGSTWRRCNAITSAGGSFLNCNFLAPTVVANTSVLVYNIATNPSGILDGTSFTKGTNAHHAIEFGTASPLSLDLNNIDFSGFSASNNVNDSMLHIKRTTGTVTINLSGVTVNGGAGALTYRTDGATVVLVASAQLELTGLKNPTEVRVYNTGTTTEIAGSENITAGTFTTSIDSATYPAVDISILALGYQNFRLINISMATDRSIPISQVIDRQYLNIVSSPLIDITSMYDQQYGYGEHIGVTGGAGFSVVTVTSSADSGAGTYRDALTAGGGSKIIRFAPALDGSTINLLSAIDCSYNNITLDGTGRNVTISDDVTRFSGTNIVIVGMNYFENNSAIDVDAITFRNATANQHFIVAFCSFARGGDGLIDIIWNAGNDVYGTIVGCYFTEHDKAILVNSGSDTLGVEGGAYYITLAHSHAYDFKQRMIFGRDMHLHHYNTHIERYGDEVAGGTVARVGDATLNGPAGFTPQYFAENNIAMPRNVGDLTYTGATVTNARNPWFSPSGTSQRMRADGSVLLSSASDTANETNGSDSANIVSPPYTGYPLATASSGFATWLSSVVGKSGAKATTLKAQTFDVPAASFIVISNGDTLTVNTENETCTGVILKLGGTTIGTLSEGVAGTWTVTLASLPAVGTTGDLTAEATYAGGTVTSSAYPACDLVRWLMIPIREGEG